MLPISQICNNTFFNHSKSGKMELGIMMGLFWGSTFMSTQLKLKLLLNSVECLPGENHVYSTALHNQCRALCVCERAPETICSRHMILQLVQLSTQLLLPLPCFYIHVSKEAPFQLNCLKVRKTNLQLFFNCKLQNKKVAVKP